MLLQTIKKELSPLRLHIIPTQIDMHQWAIPLLQTKPQTLHPSIAYLILRNV